MRYFFWTSTDFINGNLLKKVLQCQFFSLPLNSRTLVVGPLEPDGVFKSRPSGTLPSSPYVLSSRCKDTTSFLNHQTFCKLFLINTALGNSTVLRRLEQLYTRFRTRYSATVTVHGYGFTGLTSVTHQTNTPFYHLVAFRYSLLSLTLGPHH